MIVIEGNTTAPGELEDSQGLNPRLKFTVAQNERRKNPHTGEWEDGDTTFWNVTIWGRKALNAAQVLTEKGIPVLVFGKKVKVRKFDRRDGGTGFSPDITAETVGLIPRPQQPHGPYPDAPTFGGVPEPWPPAETPYF